MVFRRKRRPPTPEPPPPGPPPEDLVRLYLRGQNLEQMHRTDEAIACYEEAIAGRFDSAGPYDRLLYIYRAREDDADVVRIADAALALVRTHEQKQAWYREMGENARERMRAGTDPGGPEF